ncbi:MAG: site-specific DNA-methyltransferase [bacterium]|nr:site-specific DNA-methyltransferase [bacterium]
MARVPNIPKNVSVDHIAEAVAGSRLWLGDNRILLQQIDNESVDLVVTDPPYAISYRSNRRVAMPKFANIALDDCIDWIPEFCKQMFRVLKPKTHIYCFCRWDTYPDFFSNLKEAGFTMKRTLIWVKDNHGSGDLRGDYAPQDEWIIFASKGRKNLMEPRISNVIEVPRIASIRLKHPTEKPVDLLKILIDKSTYPRKFGEYEHEPEIVLDPFMGSGTTGVAATSLGHYFYGMEMNGEYFDVVQERLKEAIVQPDIQPERNGVPVS